jgi:Tol biopolymer transport system component
MPLRMFSMPKTTACIGVALASLLGVTRAQAPAGYELALVNLEGRKEVVALLPPNVFAPRVAPDGEHVAIETIETPAGGPRSARIWVAPLRDFAARRALPQAPSGPMNWAPMWSPDGTRIAFLVSSERPDALYWQRADGSGDLEHLLDARSAEGWAGGGSQLLYITLKGNGDYGIAMFDIMAGTSTSLIDHPESAQHSSNVSPDGRFIAYASNEAGRYEVWLEPLPQTGERHRITRDGGAHPLWSRDGRSLFFDRGQRLYRVELTLSENVRPAAPPVALPIEGFTQGEYRRQFDLMPNGREFLLLFPATSTVE